MDYLSLCIIVKDEEDYILEWLMHHALIGVEHFYIYDNDSRSSLMNIMSALPHELVTYHKVSGQEKQIPAYNHCLKVYGKNSRWIGFLDADEFLFPVQGNDLRPALAEFEEYGGLAVPWTIFGSSPHLAKPDGLVMTNFIHRYKDGGHHGNTTIKCLVDPSRTVCARDPHKFLPNSDHYFVNEMHVPVEPAGNRTLRSSQKFQLNHYFFKSQQEFEAKLQRGRADRADKESRYPYHVFFHQIQHATVPDTRILRFAPRVRAAMLDVGKVQLPSQGALQLHDVAREMVSLLREDRYQAAESLLCQAMTTSAHVAEFWSLRAVCARSVGDFDRALRFARQAMAREMNQESLHELFQAFLGLGRTVEARATLQCMMDHLGPRITAEVELKERIDQMRDQLKNSPREGAT
jgi:hypothetical protein